MENDEENDVFVQIKKEAFRNILAHTLRFGHEALEESADTMGFCLGTIEEENKIILKNALPISHGAKINESFSKDQLAQLEEKYKEQNLDLIGWYISHPSEGLKWTKNDIKNHLNIQNEERPEAFCIVVNHELIRKNDNFGFKIYRLMNYHEKEESEIKELNYHVELPNSLDYFKWVQKFVEDYHKKNPVLIKEIEELSETKPEELQEIPISEETIPEESFTISPEFKKSTDQFGDILKTLLNSEINNWMEDVSNGALQGNQKLNQTIEQMNDNYAMGMQRLNNWFQKKIDETSNDYKNTVKDKMEKRSHRISELENSISEISKNLVQSSTEIIESKHKSQYNQFKEKFDEIKILIEELEPQSSNQLKDQAKNQDTTQQLQQDLQKFSSNTLEELKTLVNENINEKIKKFEDIIEINNAIGKKYSEIEDDFKKLEKAILNLRNL